MEPDHHWYLRRLSFNSLGLFANIYSTKVLTKVWVLCYFWEFLATCKALEARRISPDALRRSFRCHPSSWYIVIRNELIILVIEIYLLIIGQDTFVWGLSFEPKLLIIRGFYCLFIVWNADLEGVVVFKLYLRKVKARLQVWYIKRRLWLKFSYSHVYELLEPFICYL